MLVARLFMDYKKVRQIRKFLSSESTNTLVHPFQCDVTFRLCNSLLYGVPKYQTDRLKDVHATNFQAIDFCTVFTAVR